MIKQTWVLRVIIFLALAVLRVEVFANVLAFEHVKLYSRSSPNSKPSKREGVLNLDRTAKSVIFVAEDRVLLTIPYDWIKSISYDRKNDHLVTIQYKDNRDQGQFAQLELNGDNRDQILAAIEAETGINISRVSS
jgi:hypothetical protein